MGKDESKDESPNKRDDLDINYIAYANLGLDDIMDEADELYFALLLSSMDRNWTNRRF